jgi:hypothetical protein
MIRFIELIGGGMVRLPPEGRGLWEEVKVVRGSSPIQ